MFTTLPAVVLALLTLSASSVDARERWLERNNRAVYLYPRRFGQEQPAVIQKLGAACPGAICGTLSGAAITPLLAAQPECSQQDMADDIIDAASQFDQATQDLMVELAIEYRQAEKNTPPDFSTDPPTPRNSVFCQKAPKNSQLNGLVQAQDPANDPNLFFDPALGASVTLGSQANTSPLSGGAGADNSTPADPVSSTSAEPVTSTDAAAASETSSPAIANVDAGNVGDFGSCSVPEIEFGVGFDNRKETSFEPVDKASFNHGSAQNIDIITQAICDTLVNSCGADQTAKDTCATARAAASAATKGTGEQADAFNAAFGVTTDFASVTSVDNQGKDVPGTGSGSTSTTGGTATSDDTSADPSVTTSASTGGSATDGTASDDTSADPSVTTSAATSASTGAAASTGGGGIGDFGSCSVPEIEFGVGFDNRKETSFQPVDQASFAHGSAQNIDIITRAICDTLVNSCDADQTAKDTCASAQAAASAATKGTGEQADAFNAAFGTTTNFADVVAVDNQGNDVAGTGSGASTDTTGDTSGAGDDGVTSTSSAAANSPTESATTAASDAGTTGGSNLQTFSGALGGITPPPVSDLGSGDRPFQVEGNAAFNDVGNALVRSCDVQHNQCANAANSSGNKGDVTVDACGQQQTECNANAQSA